MQNLLIPSICGYFNTAGKLSQVSPTEVLIIRCERHPDVPVSVEI